MVGLMQYLSTASSDCPNCAVDKYCINPTIQESCPFGTSSLAGSSSQLQCRCTAGYYCTYKQMITAVVSINISLSDWNNNTNQVRDKFKAAIAAACSVSSNDVILGKATSRTGGRRLLSFNNNRDGINVVVNALGANKIDNLQHEISKSGLLYNGHVWSENSVVLNRPSFASRFGKTGGRYHLQQHHGSTLALGQEKQFS